MKKMILMVALVLSVAKANAQLSWTAGMGTNVSNVENANSQMKLGWKVGAGADYSFSKLFSMRSILYYSAKGSSSEGSNTIDYSLVFGYKF